MSDDVRRAQLIQHVQDVIDENTARCQRTPDRLEQLDALREVIAALRAGETPQERTTDDHARSDQPQPGSSGAAPRGDDRDGSVVSQKEALRRIAAVTNADDPESYRNDDPQGCLDTVFAIAVEALR